MVGPSQARSNDGWLADFCWLQINSFEVNLDFFYAPHPADKDWATFLDENLLADPPRTQAEIEMRGVARTGKGREWLLAAQEAKPSHEKPSWTARLTLRMKKILDEKGAVAAWRWATTPRSLSPLQRHLTRRALPSSPRRKKRRRIGRSGSG